MAIYNWFNTNKTKSRSASGYSVINNVRHWPYAGTPIDFQANIEPMSRKPTNSLPNKTKSSAGMIVKRFV